MKTDNLRNIAMHQNNITEYLNSWNKLDEYSLWLYHNYEQFIGKSCVDIGGGIGTAISFYIKSVDRVIATELFQNDVDVMNDRFKSFPYFHALKLDIMNDNIDSLIKFSPDTVICINCLEHIEDDILALKKMKSIVQEKGRIIICVPAMSWLYCYMDKNVGHYRRYSRGELKRKAIMAGLKVIDNHYMNFMGIFPYWIKGHLIKSKKKDNSFSSSIGDNESKLYSIATKVLEPIEKKIKPMAGISEFIILEK